jgi:hypothetical protein
MFDNEITPIGHTNYNASTPHYRVVDLPKLPSMSNAVKVVWKVPLIMRLKILIFGRIETSHLGTTSGRIRVD